MDSFNKFEFSFVAPIHFVQKKLGEVDKISSTFIFCDHVRNSHDHSVSQSVDITRRNLMPITLRAERVNISGIKNDFDLVESKNSLNPWTKRRR